MRIAFLVNNNALGDTRVVKTAEVLHQAGAECVVFGCTRAPGEVGSTVRNGVRYEVLPLKNSLILDVAATCLPALYARLVRLRSRKPGARNEREAVAGSAGDVDVRFVTATELLATTPQEPGPPAEESTTATRLPLWKRVLKPVIAIPRTALRLFRGLLSRARRNLVGVLQPKQSVVGVRGMFGRYLRTFLPALSADTFDVLYGHELWMLETTVLAKQATGARCVVYDSHELELHRNNDWSETANKARTDYEAKYIADCDVVVTVCGKIAEYLQTTYGIAMPHVVPNAPWSEQYQPVSAECRLKASLGLGAERLLVYTGKATIGRGLDLIVGALRSAPDLHLAIVGPRVPWVAAEAAQRAVDLGVGDRVYFVDPVAPDFLVSLISDGDLAVVPIENVCLSYYYSLPNKIFEAAMAGLPILASDFPELEKFVDTHEVGTTVDFTDPQAVSGQLLHTLAYADRYNSPGKGERLMAALSFDRPLVPVLDQISLALARGA